MKNIEKLVLLNKQIEDIIDQAHKLESEHASLIAKVHPSHKKSALNLVHYLAFRSFDIDQLQEQLRYNGLPDLSNIEGHVMKSLLAIRTILNSLVNNERVEGQKGIISIKKSEKILKKNTKKLFGYKSKKRRTRIMVTMPSTAAEDYSLVNHLIALGMNSARINCAHDTPDVWAKMIGNIKRANKTLDRKCKVMMDLGGPKIRTGAIKLGPKLVRIKPQRDQLGNVVKPAKVWIAPPDVLPPDKTADAIIPVNESLVKKIKRGTNIYFTDSRDKKCIITIERKQGAGKWGLCSDSAYLTTETELHFSRVKQSGKEKNYVGELLPLEQYIILNVGDQLILHKDSNPGEPAVTDDDGKVVKPAHISCTLPIVFKDVKVGVPILFDDGKIEGIVRESNEERLLVEILYAKDTGSKLKADKGINLPDSILSISGLTEKDRKDLEFVAVNADVVNLSFVNREQDVQLLLDELEKYDTKVGIILKIETKSGFNNLPKILLKAMQTAPIGVMIARGDLAVETGWKNFATIQEEIMRISEAAHVPVVWATQVLENLAKKGVPTRSEITDAAAAQRTECVMLNKGRYIEKAVKMLSKILKRLQYFQKKKETMLPKLENAEQLLISHESFDV